MKPDADAHSGMEEVEENAEKLFLDLGILISDGRQPENSLKGRKEGVHCPPFNASHGQTHKCQYDNKQCVKFKQTESEILLLWQNRIPMSLEVLLYPDCHYGYHKSETTNDGSQCLLLEQWTIQVTAKRCNEAYVTGCMLIQAVRSYLHFSQLSAWYSSTRGLNPTAVVYRICAPGESLAHNFEGAIDHHEFPKVYLDRTSSMKVSVKSLPRQKTIPSLTCIVPHTDKDDDDDVTSDLICEGFTVEPLLLHEAEKQGAKRKQCRPVAIGIQEGKTNNTTCEEKYQTNIPVRKKSQQMDILPRVKKQQTNKYDLYDSYSTYNAMQPEYGEKKQQTSKYDLYDSYSTHNAMQTENGEKKQQTRKYDLYGSYSNHNAMQTEYGGEISSIYANNPDDIERCLDELCLKDKREVFQKHEHKEKLAYKNEDGDFWLFRRKGRTLQGTLENVQKQTSSLLNTVLRRITDKKQPQEEHANESSKKCDDQFKVKSNIQDNPAQSAVKPDIQNSHAESAVKPDIQNNLAQSVVKPDIQDNFSQSVVKPDIQDSHAESDYHVKQEVEEETCQMQNGDSLQRSGQILHDLSNGAQYKVLNQDFDSQPLWQPPQKCGCDYKSLEDSNDDSQSDCDKCCKDQIENTPCYNSEYSPCQYTEEELNTPHKYEDRGMIRSKTSPALASLLRKSFVDGNPCNTVFHPKTGLPINSSPAPPRRINRNSYDFDQSMTNLNNMDYDQGCVFNRPLSASTKLLSKSAPASTTSLLGNFEESVLNGRLEPVGTVDGFSADIGASGTFCPKHIILPVNAYFFDISDDNAPSPYLGHICLKSLGRKGYHVPKKGTVQITLFNPNKTVVKMFVVIYNLEDMPTNCQTFIRQRTYYMPSNAALDDDDSVRELRYLIHLRFMSTKSGHIYLHTDIRLIFARHRSDMDSGYTEYELKSFTEMPSNPKFSPKK